MDSLKLQKRLSIEGMHVGIWFSICLMTLHACQEPSVNPRGDAAASSNLATQIVDPRAGQEQPNSDTSDTETILKTVKLDSPNVRFGVPRRIILPSGGTPEERKREAERISETGRQYGPDNLFRHERVLDSVLTKDECVYTTGVGRGAGYGFDKLLRVYVTNKSPTVLEWQLYEKWSKCITAIKRGWHGQSDDDLLEGAWGEISLAWSVDGSSKDCGNIFNEHLELSFIDFPKQTIVLVLLAQDDNSGQARKYLEAIQKSFVWDGHIRMRSVDWRFYSSETP